MNTKSYIFAGIIAAITSTNAMATGENIIASKSYTDTKQTKIPLGSLEIDAGKGIMLDVPHSLVAYPTTNIGEIGEYGIMDADFFDSNAAIGSMSNLRLASMMNDMYADMIPSVGAVANMVNNELTRELPLKQNTIPKSGNADLGDGSPYSASNSSLPSSWLNPDVKGTGLVTRTSTNGVVGERKIFEASDVSGYHAQGLTQNEKDVQDISIPTVGAMMSAISSGVSAAAPSGTPNTIANYDANGALGSGIATANAPSYNNGSLTNGTNIATIAAVDTAMNTRQAKKVCAGWPDGTTTYDSTHTDANCWLWTLPD